MTLAEIDCAVCGLAFGVPDSFNRRCRTDGRRFFCPSGHVNVYTDNEHDRTRRERDKLKQELARKDEEIRHERERGDRWKADAQHTEHRRRAAAGQVTKLKKRAAAGVCPCCNRSFSDLRHHMAAKHPMFIAEPVEGEEVT